MPESALGRIIRGAVVSSTTRDRHGEAITRRELKSLFKQIPSERLLNVDHDLLQPPVARAFNTRLEKLENGELGIVSDIEVFDEGRFPEGGGVSISFHRGAPNAQKRKPADVVVSFNPRHVAPEKVNAALAAVPEFPGRIVARERADKSLIVTLVLVWVVVSHGFFEEARADLYRLCKRLAKDALELGKRGEVGLMIEATKERPQLILTMPTGLDPEAVTADSDGLIEQAQALAPGNELVKVVARLDDRGAPAIDFAVDEHGTTFRPPPAEAPEASA